MRIALIGKALGAQMLLAFSVTQAWAAPCVTPPMSPEAIAHFKSNPQAMVAPDSDTRTIEAFVRDLTGTDPALAEDVVRVAQGTTPRFQTAIAAGLAQAAVACSNLDQQASLLIQQAVAGFENGEFQNAFAAVAGDLSTAATAAATASAESSVGSVVVTNPDAAAGLTTNPGGAGTAALVQIVSGGISIAAVNGPTLTNSTTAAGPVSATH
jgi:hypothetical protein